MIKPSIPICGFSDQFQENKVSSNRFCPLRLTFQQVEPWQPYRTQAPALQTRLRLDSLLLPREKQAVNTLKRKYSKLTGQDPETDRDLFFTWEIVQKTGQHGPPSASASQHFVLGKENTGIAAATDG